MGKEPWRSISLGIVRSPEVRLSVREARESPCDSCETVPCCSHLPLHSFRVENMIGFDHARYLLNFDRIELGISASGQWQVYYRYPCRFLERSSFRCKLHGSPEQPSVCEHYNPYSCWYRRTLQRGETDGFVRIDRTRLEALGEQIVFDRDRNIVDVPDWSTLCKTVAKLDSVRLVEGDENIGVDPQRTAWQRQVVERSAPERPAELRRFAQLRDPCTGCGAHCCRVLMFPIPTPETYGSLDYLKFSLGFPGVEIGVSDEGWSIVVSTTCRHLRDDRCSVYGRSERPILCSYYDASHCAYKPQFSVPRPESLLRLQLEDFATLAGSVEFDDQGAITNLPTKNELRDLIEQGWRAAAGAQPGER